MENFQGIFQQSPIAQAWSKSRSPGFLESGPLAFRHSLRAKLKDLQRSEHELQEPGTCCFLCLKSGKNLEEVGGKQGVIHVVLFHFQISWTHHFFVCLMLGPPSFGEVAWTFHILQVTRVSNQVSLWDHDIAHIGWIKQCKSVVNFRDFLLHCELLGLVIYNDLCLWTLHGIFW